jgi:hypothetical protein
LKSGGGTCCEYSPYILRKKKQRKEVKKVTSSNICFFLYLNAREIASILFYPLFLLGNILSVLTAT